MRGNTKVLQSLLAFYQDLRRNSKFSVGQACEADISSFASQVESFIYDSDMQIERAKLLGEILTARKTLVSIFFFMEITCIRMYS